MSTDIKLLQKGLIKLGFLLLLFILTPILLTISYKALARFTEAPKIFIAYGLLIASGILLIYTLIFAIKTFKVLLDAFFTNN